MHIYLVGGAVRDTLLDVPFHERDWVVVGATPQELLDQGFTPVGKDFPVFLHPETKEEYALARTERKQGHGYTGFDVHFEPSVTLEEDLRRRDLTINAIAQRPDGTLVDPYGGRRDLEQRLLRHVSEAFVEDPLRVLRTARFAARYAPLGFTIAPETLDLMATITAQGELAHLAMERVWVETERALREDDPATYFRVLRDCGALAALFPEVDALFGVPQRADYHPEVDSGIHTLMVLAQAARLSGTSEVRWAALLHDLGKADTPTDVLPQHIGHEKRGLRRINALCDRIKAPNAHRELALTACEYHLLAHRSHELTGKTLLKLLTATGALRPEGRFELFLTVCEADARGRLGKEEAPYPQADYLRRARDIAVGVTAAAFVEQGLKGKAIGEGIARERVRQLEGLRRLQS
ncbi:MAG: multifunctional CCA addition/repair protein [Chromatocurvus sp.]